MRSAILLGAFALTARAQDQSLPNRARFSGSFQTGLAETFQLTLGGRFGNGPAWQSRLNLHWDFLLRPGDRLTLTGWKTHDLPTHGNDWLAGILYRPGALKSRRWQSQVSYGFGVQRWRFPSVACGTQDWLVAAEADWASRLPLSPWATSEFWYNIHSNVPRGSLLYSQGGVQHRLLNRDQRILTFKHGIAFTQAWGLYGKHGSRVVRYTGTLAATWGNNTVEVGLRPQHALQANIPQNVFWFFSITRRF